MQSKGKARKKISAFQSFRQVPPIANKTYKTWAIFLCPYMRWDEMNPTRGARRDCCLHTFLPPVPSWQGQGAGLVAFLQQGLESPCQQQLGDRRSRPRCLCTFSRQRVPPTRSLPGSLPSPPPACGLERHRAWRRSGGLGTELWSAWEAPRTQQEGQS